MFTSIAIGQSVKDSGSLIEKSDKGAVKKKRTVVRSTAAANDVSGKWSFKNLPAGFAVKHHRQRIHGNNSRDIEHYIFSDGISSFSVYIEKTDKVRLNGNAHLGALNAYGVFLNGHQVTAVGEVPPETLEFISELVIGND
jgi:sigma-E factor negative regulatory protein RseB